MVFTSRPSASRPSIRHDNMDRPSTRTAQVPHSPSSQPCFVPVRFRSSRNTSSRVLCGAKATSASSPFRTNLMCVFCFIRPTAFCAFRAYSRKGGLLKSLDLAIANRLSVQYRERSDRILPSACQYSIASAATGYYQALVSTVSRAQRPDITKRLSVQYRERSDRILPSACQYSIASAATGYYQALVSTVSRAQRPDITKRFSVQYRERGDRILPSACLYSTAS